MYSHNGAHSQTILTVTFQIKLDGINSGSWYHCLPIKIYHWLGEGGQVSLPCNILLHTQLPYSLPLLINDTSLLVSNGMHCLNLLQPIRNLASTVASTNQLCSKIYPLAPDLHWHQCLHYTKTKSIIFKAVTFKQVFVLDEQVWWK